MDMLRCDGERHGFAGFDGDGAGKPREEAWSSPADMAVNDGVRAQHFDEIDGERDRRGAVDGEMLRPEADGDGAARRRRGAAQKGAAFEHDGTGFGGAA